MFNMKFQSTFKLLLEVFIIVSPVASFYPNRLGLVQLTDNDHTLEDITESGILLAVAKYFESTPLSDRPTLNPGDLTELEPLTASTLYSAYYGEGKVSPQKFETAIQEIVSENTRISNKKSKKAYWHMNGEAMKKGNNKIKKLRTSMNSVLNDTIPDYSVARMWIGRILHIMQMFYSNTDWLEMQIYEHYLTTKLIKPELVNTYADLGIDGKPFLAVANSGKETCLNCRTGVGEYECFYNRHNAIKGTRYTSGYLSGQDVVKPEGAGKCSHGGSFDETRHREATGGINKQTTIPKLSPHYYYHKDAARLAIEATMDYFVHADYGILKTIGGVDFRSILNLGTGATLAMVIDDTGSMSAEIATVIAECIKIVNNTAGTVNAPYNYVVVTFNDPLYGPAFVTRDPDECIKYLKGISVSGGGDCPEMCFSGIELALTNCLRNSDVYVFTDADPKDEHKQSNVVALAKQTNSRIQFILTGACTTARRRRDIGQVSSLSSGGPMSSSSYDLIAEESGGAVYEGSKSEIDEMVNLLEIKVGASLVYIAKNYITRFQTSLFVIDKTLSTFTLTISSGSSINAIVYTPSGTELDLASTNVTVNVNTASVFSVTVKSPELGEWSCNCSDSDFCDVEVISQSTVDFQYQLITVDESTGLANDIDGSPVGGAELLIYIKVFGVTDISSVDQVELVNPSGVVVRDIRLSKVETETDDSYSANFIVPSEAFSVSLKASDEDGNVIRRLQPTTVRPETFQLVQISSDTEELIAGSSIVTKFRIINTGPSKLFNISDSITGGDASISSSTSPSSVYASASSEGNITHTLSASSAAQIGTPLTVTVRAEDTSTGSFNYVIFSTSVDGASTLEEDDELPTLSNISKTGACGNDTLKQHTCSHHSWIRTYEFTDNTAIGSITFYPPIDIEKLSSSSSGATSSVTLNGTCCCPLLTVTAADLYGNSLTISANMTEPGTPSPVCIPPEPIALPPGVFSNATANFTSTVKSTTGVYSTDAITTVSNSSESSTDADYFTLNSTIVINYSDATITTDIGTTDAENKEPSTLPGGIIAAIVVVSVLVLGVVIGISKFIWKKKQTNRVDSKVEDSQELEL